MVISIASQKGGVGKTTTAISLAAGLARKGKQVLLIDIDSQANSSKVLISDYQTVQKDETIYTTILERRPLPTQATRVPNLSIVPSHILLSNTDIQLTTALDHREARLKTELERIKPQYEYVVIDCPPTLSWLTVGMARPCQSEYDTGVHPFGQTERGQGHGADEFIEAV